MVEQSGCLVATMGISVRDDVLAAVVTHPASGPAGKIAIMSHGGPGGAKDGPCDLFKVLAEQLASVGISSMRFDFAGVGESTGSYRDTTIQRQVEELKAVMAYAKNELCSTSMALIGESFGATSTILGFEDNTACLVLLWPCIWLLDKALAQFVTPEKLAIARQNGFIVEDGEEVGLGLLNEAIETDNVADRLIALPTPTLFIHGDSDQEVPYEQSVRAAKLLAGPQRVVIVPQGDHCLRRPNERVIVNREIVSWLNSYL